MRDAGIKVLTVREIMAFGVDTHVRARMALEHLAMAALTYELHPDVNLQSLSDADREYLSDNYKRKVCIIALNKGGALSPTVPQVLEHMSTAQLIDTILINPTVLLQPSGRDTGLTATYSFQPLSNLVYTRDQQITTSRGIVMGRLRSQQRMLEVDLMAFCFAKLGAGGGITLSLLLKLLIITLTTTNTSMCVLFSNRTACAGAHHRTRLSRGRRLLPSRQRPGAHWHRPAQQHGGMSTTHGQ